MPCNVYTHRRGDKQIDASRQQLYGSAFGNNPMRAPDLSGLELHFDRGFSGEKAHSDLYSPTNADSTCTTQRADWAAHNFGQMPKENDKRHYIDTKGIMALYLSEKTINNRKIASGAFATGTDNVVLFMSTVHRSLKCHARISGITVLGNEHTLVSQQHLSPPCLRLSLIPANTM